ncbi:MAG: carbon monoxide dehydrogenase subunit G [Chloroflexota bacterium]
MRIEGEYIFNGPREDVWEIIRDPEVLTKALPGTQSLKQVSESIYEGELFVRVGPVVGSFSGRLEVSNEVHPESLTLTVEGEGKPGFAKGSGDVQFIDRGDGTTLLKYAGEVQIGGKIASVGQRLLDTVSKSMARQGLGAVDEALQARIKAKTGGEQVEYKPPSEVEFAAAVAKDMASEVFSSRWVWLVVALVAVIILAIVFITSFR